MSYVLESFPEVDSTDEAELECDKARPGSTLASLYSRNMFLHVQDHYLNQLIDAFAHDWEQIEVAIAGRTDLFPDKHIHVGNIYPIGTAHGDLTPWRPGGL